jgi:hypothetical protein
MGMTITITVEEQVGGEILKADRILLDLEVDYAAFDVICHTVNKLREEVEQEKQKYLHNHNA